MSAPLVFIDTETDGVHPDRKVWEVAMIRRDETGATWGQSTFVSIDLSTADPFGLKVGGFYDRHPLGRQISDNQPPTIDYSQYDQTSDEDVLSEMDAALWVARMTHGAHLVGAVPNFDAEVLATLLRDNGLIPSWHHHLIDVEAMAVGWLSGRNKCDPDQYLLSLPWKSDLLSKACGVEPPTDAERHTAMGDATWAKRWYDAMTGGASE